jgi:hypothetical protein
LRLAKNALTQLPVNICELSKLEYLNLENNALTSLPEKIGVLKNLKELRLKENGLTVLPISIGDLGSLYSLDLTGNHELPDCEAVYKNGKEETQAFLSGRSLQTEIPIDFLRKTIVARVA